MYARVAYGPLRRLWSRIKQSSKQWSVPECEMSKSELRMLDYKVWVEGVQWFRRKDKHARSGLRVQIRMFEPKQCSDCAEKKRMLQ